MNAVAHIIYIKFHYYSKVCIWDMPYSVITGTNLLSAPIKPILTKTIVNTEIHHSVFGKQVTFRWK